MVVEIFEISPPEMPKNGLNVDQINKGFHHGGRNFLKFDRLKCHKMAFMLT